MYEAYAVLNAVNPDGTLIETGMTPDGGNWAICDQGQRTVNGVTDQYWSPIRWNSGDPTPALPITVTVVWRSDRDPPETYPEGVTVFA